MQDYRAQSYKKYAQEKVRKRSDYARFNTKGISTSSNPEGNYVGASTGDVSIKQGSKAENQALALKGQASKNVIYSSGGDTAFRKDTDQMKQEATQKQAQQQEAKSQEALKGRIAFFSKQENPVFMSGGFYGKYQQQSIRGDSIYYQGVQKRQLPVSKGEASALKTMNVTYFNFDKSRYDSKEIIDTRSSKEELASKVNLGLKNLEVAYDFASIENKRAKVKANSLTYNFFVANPNEFVIKQGKRQAQFIGETPKYFVEKPYEAGATFLIGGALGAVAGASQKFLSSAGTKFIPKSISSKTIPIILTTLGVSIAVKDVSSVVKTSQNEEQLIKGFGGLSASYGTFGAGFEILPKLTKNLFITSVAERVPTEQVFEASVLEGRTRFPEAKSVKESLASFNTKNEGKIIVQTSAPSKLSSNVADIGKKAKLNLEDSGIYVTPEGRGSPAFLGVSESRLGDYSLIPSSESFSTPAVTRFEVNKVIQYPRDVISTRGFEDINLFQESVLSKKGVAVITKRSELGLGNIPVDYSIKGNMKFGSIELEAVIPKGTSFFYTGKNRFNKVIGFSQYTTFKGEVVILRDAKLEGLNSKFNLASGSYNKELSFEKISRESSLLSSVSKKRTPIFSIFSSRLSSPKSSVSSPISYKSGSSSIFSSRLSSPKSSVSSPISYKSGSSSIFSSRLSSPKSSVSSPISYKSRIKTPKISSSFFKFPSFQRSAKRESFKYSKKSKKRDLTALYVLPDAFSVSQTEARTSNIFSSKSQEAFTPKLTKKIRLQAEKAFSGMSSGTIYTEQIRRGMNL
jgi:hypothetical protein